MHFYPDISAVLHQPLINTIGCLLELRGSSSTGMLWLISSFVLMDDEAVIVQTQSQSMPDMNQDHTEKVRPTCSCSTIPVYFYMMWFWSESVCARHGVFLKGPLLFRNVGLSNLLVGKMDYKYKIGSNQIKKIHKTIHLKCQKTSLAYKKCIRAFASKRLKRSKCRSRINLVPFKKKKWK